MIVSIMDDSPGCLINESLIGVEQHATVRARCVALMLFLKSNRPQKKRNCATRRLFPISRKKKRADILKAGQLLLCPKY